MIRTLPVREFAKALDLNILHMGKREYMELHTSDINRPGLQLTGFFELFVFDRVQIMGPVEMAYLKRLDKQKLKETMERYFSYPIPCVLISRQQIPPGEMMEAARKNDVPILDSPLTTTKIMHKTMTYLDNYLAPQATRHGVLMDIYGVGIMLTGESGIGKSETALELVERGHRMVADDVVTVRRGREGIVYALASPVIEHHMEIRGVGIIDVKSVYGVGCVRNSKRIGLVVELEMWNETAQYDRTGLVDEYVDILRTRIPYLLIPVRPGRNIAIIVEVAALNHRLKELGVHPAQQLNQKLLNLMSVGDA